MARDREDRNRTAKDVGSDSPASEEAKEQTRTGIQGAPRGTGEAGGTDRQPGQSSGRSGGGPEPTARKHFDDDERPSAQGEGEPAPERLRTSPGQQGVGGKSGTTAGGQQRGEDEATVHEA